MGAMTRLPVSGTPVPSRAEDALVVIEAREGKPLRQARERGHDLDRMAVEDVGLERCHGLLKGDLALRHGQGLADPEHRTLHQRGMLVMVGQGHIVSGFPQPGASLDDHAVQSPGVGTGAVADEQDPQGTEGSDGERRCQSGLCFRYIAMTGPRLSDPLRQFVDPMGGPLSFRFPPGR